LASQRSLDLIQEIIEGSAQMPQNKTKLGKGCVENVIVVLDDLVPMLFPVLTRGACKQQVCQISGRRQILGRMKVNHEAFFRVTGLLVGTKHEIAHPHIPMADCIESGPKRITGPPQFEQKLKDFIGDFAQL
jgi:hypothetical protein